MDEQLLLGNQANVFLIGRRELLLLRYAHLVQSSRWAVEHHVFQTHKKKKKIHRSRIQIHYFDAKAIIFYLMLIPSHHNLILYLKIKHFPPLMCVHDAPHYSLFCSSHQHLRQGMLACQFNVHVTKYSLMLSQHDPSQDWTRFTSLLPKSTHNASFLTEGMFSDCCRSTRSLNLFSLYPLMQSFQVINSLTSAT